jgi:hypothetical protein
MKISQYHQCDWNQTNPTPITDHAVSTTARGVTMVVPVGTDKRGYKVTVHLSLDDLLEMTSYALAAEGVERVAREERDILAARARAVA